MADTVNLNIRVDRELKENAEAFFAALGLNTTTAITLFMRQSLREQKIPFEIRMVPFAMSGNAYLFDYRTSLQQLSEGHIVTFDSVEDLIKQTEVPEREDPVY
ncbi:MAG: type II toxin-antitoxin system RelB/DinJ family antitoxin [Symbiobacteriaceae bacterium]|nr:type II toxin-antitoxin system RelB/DinJ family antitoxin [Symbiobacteriaceae bacterium]